LTVNYWHLKNKDLSMQKFAKERTEIIFNKFVKLIEECCEGSYENVYAIDQPVYYKSDQRLDFMMNVYQEIIKHASSKLEKLENERDRRL
jgi:hypothetical protein